MTERDHIHNLSVLLLRPADAETVARKIAAAPETDRAEMLKLASANHVVIRAFTALQQAAEQINEPVTSNWAAQAIDHEQADIDNSLRYLNDICQALEQRGCPTTVIKSL